MYGTFTYTPTHAASEVLPGARRRFNSAPGSTSEAPVCIFICIHAYHIYYTHSHTHTHALPPGRHTMRPTAGNRWEVWCSNTASCVTSASSCAWSVYTYTYAPARPPARPPPRAHTHTYTHTHTILGVPAPSREAHRCLIGSGRKRGRRRERRINERRSERRNAMMPGHSIWQASLMRPCFDEV